MLGRQADYISPDEMKELEVGASKYGLGVKDLMENAGKAVAEFVISRYGMSRDVCVVCGGGNNGGDGFVAARYLSERCRARVILLTDPSNIRTKESCENWEALRGTPAEVFVAGDVEELANVSWTISGSDVVVDAVFGTGVTGGVVKEPFARAISMVNGARGIKVAVDLPSGIDPGTGEVSRPSVRADVTLALHLPKVGLRGREEFTGEVVVLPIGIQGRGGT